MGAHRRWIGIRAIAVAACVAVGAAAPVSADVDRAFTQRFTDDVSGNVAIVGNANVSCTSGSAACIAAQNASPATTTDDPNINNDALSSMGGVFGGDSDAAVTANSSKATLTLPPGSQVLFAGLYWSGTTSALGGAAPSPSDTGKVLLKTPGATSYGQVTATQLDTLSPAAFGGFYQGFVNITSQVQAAGSGSYQVANIQAGSGMRAYAGWSLVVAYRDPAEPLRNLTIWDGFRGVDAGTSVAIPVTGFKTPLSGAVKTDLGFVAWEGDRGITGDGASITDTTPGHAGTPQALSNTSNPVGNLFNSSITRKGTEATDRTPSYSNNFGVDEDVFASAGLTNNATSASINLTTTGDVYAPGVVTFATELYAPDISQTNTVTDDNGGAVEPGDTLTYDIAGTNGGGDAANSLIVRNDVPANTAYVPGSAAVVSGPDGSTASYDPGTARATFALGTLAPSASYHVRLKLKVSAGAADATQIDDTAVASFTGATLGVADSVSTTASKTVSVVPADLSLVKTADRESGQPGDVITYTIVVHNAGPGTARNTRVIDTIPEGTSLSEGPGCTATGRTVTCPLGDLLTGADVTRVLKVLVGAGASGNLVNFATVTSDTPDPNGSNNTNPANSAAVTVPRPPSDESPASTSDTSSGTSSGPSGPSGPSGLSGPLTPPVTPSECTDKTKPITTLVRRNVRGAGAVHLAAASGVTLKGTSTDPAPCASGLKRVQVSLARVAGRTGVNCRFLTRADRYQLTKPQNCRRPVLFNARGTASWSFSLPVKLKPGKYRAQARGVDQKNNKETPKKGRSIVYFTVR